MKALSEKMKYFEEVEKVSPEIYYHYTTLDSLYEIVNSKTFRLTGIRLPDSKREAFYNPEQFLADLDRVIASEADEDKENYFRLLRESIARNKEKFLRECRARRSLYALCLSEKKDSIAYWERYASECTGVCICFNIATLKAYLQRSEIPAFGASLYDVGKAICAETAREKYIRDRLVYSMDLLYEQDGQKHGQMNLCEMIRSNGYGYAADTYLQLVKFTNKDSFLDDYEVRLYHDTAFIKSTLRLVDWMENDIKTEQCHKLKKHFTDEIRNWKLDREQFCMTKKGIRGCRDLCLEEIWGAGIISEIILGPRCAQSSSELKKFLKANGLEGTKVSVSKVLMR